LAKKTEAKSNTIKKKKKRLLNRELAYNVSISHLREEIKQLKHHREVIKHRINNCDSECFTKYHCKRRQRKCAWSVTDQSQTK
jgi:hypothetical protein